MKTMKKDLNFGYPLYPVKEDIYFQFKEEQDINPDNRLTDKNSPELNLPFNLDVPGAELDDIQEEIGSEDEENNYYSIGGDDHSNLDENHE